jgi:uncharacterized protein
MNKLKNSDRVKLKHYIILTFLLSWGLAGFFYLLFGGLDHPLALPMVSLYMFTPAISVFILQKFIYKENFKEKYGIFFRPNKWFAVALLLPLVMAVAAFFVSLLFPNVNFSPGMEGLYARFEETFGAEQVETMRQQAANLPIHPFWLTLVQALIAGATINAVFAFGEELGWRGFMNYHLRTLGFWQRSAVIGAVWGIWHAPIIAQGHNYPGFPVIGIFLMTAWTVLLSPLFTYIRERSGSVIAPSILHGSLNASGGLAIMLVEGGNVLLTGITGLAGFIVLAAVNLWLYFKLKTTTVLKSRTF